MKRALMIRFALLFSLFFVLFTAGAQTAIDKPVATIKLVRQELVSQRQLKADISRLENALGSKLTAGDIRQILDARVNSMLFLQFCEREKISVKDEDVTAMLGRMKASLGEKATDADLENALRADGVFVEPKVFARQRLLFQTYVQTRKSAELKAAAAEPSADDILKAYADAKAALTMPDTMRVSVLYVDTRGKSEDAVRKAKETITGLQAAVKSNPAKFDELMLRAGDAAGYKALPNVYVERTAQNKSLFGPEFYDAVFRLKTGEVSPVVESATGFRLIRANEFSAQHLLNLSDPVPGNQGITVQQFLAIQISQERQGAALDTLEATLIAQLRKEATIKIFEENLAF